MEEMLLRQILEKIGGIETDISGMKADIAEMKADIVEMKADIVDNRHKQVMFEDKFDRQMGAIMDTHKASMDAWSECRTLLARTNALLDRAEASQEAIDVKLYDHEGRIVTLEQKAG